MGPNARQPNILFIMTDQQRYDALSCHGGQAITPHLDRLTALGGDFARFFTQSPVCVPSRRNLFTGRTQVARGYEHSQGLSPTEIHLFKALKQAGYHLGYVGKNHLLAESEFKNFDLVQIGEKDRANDPDRQAYVALHMQQLARLGTVGSWASSCFYDLDPQTSDTYLRRASAIEYLQNVPADRPFCLTVSFSDPHVPHLAPAKFKDWYPLDKIRVPECPPDVLDHKAPRFTIKQAAQKVHAATDEDRRTYLAVYWAMISWVDENIGAILAALDATGRRQDTIIVFTADHGDFGWDYGMVKKDLVLLDLLLHVPCVMVWDGQIDPCVMRDTLAEQIDVMPTLLELCGVTVPVGCQGQSLAPLLRGRATTHKDAVYAEACNPDSRNPYQTYEKFLGDWTAHHDKPGHLLTWTANFNVPGDFTRSVRTADWKYIRYGSGFEELYDLRRDPQEFVNLAPRPEHRQTCAGLKAQMERWAQQSVDPRDAATRARDAAKYDLWE
jgi:arylsulfatase